MSENKETKLTHTYPPVVLTIWQDAWVAISQPNKALKWALQPFKRSVVYLVLLSIVLSLVSTAYFFINLRPAIESFRDWAIASIPEVSLQEGLLSIKDDQTISFTDSDTFFFKVDPTQSSEEQPAIDSFYEAGILITSDQLIFKDARSIETINFSEFSDAEINFDGKSIGSFIDQKLIPASFIFIPLIVFLYTVVAKLFYSLLFSVLYWFLTGLKYDLMRMWSIAIYSLTPAIVAGYISFIFAPVFGLYTMVFLFYFWFGLNSLRKFKAILPSA